MKKHFKNSLTALLIVFAALAGCKSDAPSAPVPLPNIADFAITGSSPFDAGTSSTLNVSCSSMGSGTYTVYFSLAGADTLQAGSASLVLSGGTGSFKTPALPNPGLVFLTLNSITNINGGGTLFPPNTSYTLNDSTGEMAATIGGSTTFNAADVLATITGNTLTIRGEVDEPGLTTITLYIDNFTNQTGVTYFSSTIVPAVASAMYTSTSVAGGGSLSANGTINIISLSPLIAGTFSFTCMDSTKITSGSFSAVAPTN